jgi:hypothetical protein
MSIRAAALELHLLSEKKINAPLFLSPSEKATPTSEILPSNGPNTKGQQLLQRHGFGSELIRRQLKSELRRGEDEL